MSWRLTVNAPEEFKHLAQCFWQGSEREAKDEDDWIEHALSLAGAERQKVIRKFLTEFLLSNPSIPEIQRVWQSGGPSYGLHDQHARAFFEKIRDMAKG